MTTAKELIEQLESRNETVRMAIADRDATNNTLKFHVEGHGNVSEVYEAADGVRVKVWERTLTPESAHALGKWLLELFPEAP